MPAPSGTAERNPEPSHHRGARSPLSGRPADPGARRFSAAEKPVRGRRRKLVRRGFRGPFRDRGRIQKQEFAGIPPAAERYMKRGTGRLLPASPAALTVWNFAGKRLCRNRRRGRPPPLSFAAR
ncbi:MAG: hypothetical protein BAA03_03185 [Caldibacillus debilis]|nr:MAG: hypothetical protein BAA03_03185 [Caldibacillus debilis]